MSKGGYYNNVNLRTELDLQNIFNIHELQGKKLEDFDALINNVVQFVINNGTMVSSNGVILNGSIDDDDIYQITDDITFKKLSKEEIANIDLKPKTLYNLNYYSARNFTVSIPVLLSIYTELLNIKLKQNDINICPDIKYLNIPMYRLYSLFFDDIGNPTKNFNPIKILINCDMLSEVLQLLQLESDINIEKLYPGYSYNPKKIEAIFKNQQVKPFFDQIDNIIRPKFNSIINMVSIERVKNLANKILSTSFNDKIKKYFEKIGLNEHNVDYIIEEFTGFGKSTSWENQEEKEYRPASIYDIFTYYVGDNLDFENIRIIVDTFFKNNPRASLIEVKKILSMVFMLRNIKWEKYVNEVPILKGTLFIYSPKSITYAIDKVKESIKNCIINDINNLHPLIRSLYKYYNCTKDFINLYAVPELRNANAEIIKVKKVFEVVLKQKCVYEDNEKFCANLKDLLIIELNNVNIVDNFKILLEENIKNKDIIDNSVNLMQIITTYFNNNDKTLANIIELRDEILNVANVMETNEIKQVESTINNINKKITNINKRITQLEGFINLKEKPPAKRIKKMLSIKDKNVNTLEEITEFINIQLESLHNDLKEKIKEYNIALKRQKHAHKNNNLTADINDGTSYYRYVIVLLAKIIKLHFEVSNLSEYNENVAIIFMYINKILEDMTYNDCDKVIQTYNNKNSTYGIIPPLQMKIIYNPITIKTVAGFPTCMENGILNFITYLLFDESINEININKLTEINALPDVVTFYKKYYNFNILNHQNASKEWVYLLSSTVRLIMMENKYINIDNIFFRKITFDNKDYYELRVNMDELLFIMQILLGYNGNDILTFINQTFNKNLEINSNTLQDDNIKIEIYPIHMSFTSEVEYDHLDLFINALDEASISDTLVHSLYDNPYYNDEYNFNNLLPFHDNYDYTDDIQSILDMDINNFIIYIEIFANCSYHYISSINFNSQILYAIAYKAYINYAKKEYIDKILLKKTKWESTSYNIFINFEEKSHYVSNKSYINFLYDTQDITGYSNLELYIITICWYFMKYSFSIGEKYDVGPWVILNKIESKLYNNINVNEDILSDFNNINDETTNFYAKIVNEKTILMLNDTVQIECILRVLIICYDIIAYANLRENKTLLKIINERIDVSKNAKVLKSSMQLVD